MTATIAIIGILAALLAMLLLLGSRRVTLLLAPEIRRKVLHISMGCVTLFLPQIFDTALQVWCLAGLAVGMLIVIRRNRLLRARAGGALHSIERNSIGDLCFPLGVATLFSLAGEDYRLYLVPMLILTFGDSCAALVGMFRGRFRFATPDGQKTLEGSLTLFGLSLLFVVLVFGFSGPDGWHPLLLVGFNVAVFITLVEAVTWRGTDNFVIPVAGFWLLETYRQMSVAELQVQALLAIALSSVALLVSYPFQPEGE